MTNLTSDVSFYCTSLDNAIHYYEVFLLKNEISDIKIIVKFKQITLDEIATKKIIGTLNGKLCLFWYNNDKKIFSRLLNKNEIVLTKNKISLLFLTEFNEKITQEKSLKDSILKEQIRITQEKNRNKKPKL